MNETEGVEPISSHDTKRLKEYFEKNIPNPMESLSWKLIKLGDQLLEHPNPVIRWVSIVPCLLIGGIMWAIDKVGRKL